MKKIDFAIIGACVSRDIFQSTINENYKNLYSCSAYKDKTSIISLMSKPISIDKNKLDNLDEYNTQRLSSEFDKTFMLQMAKDNPTLKYIIIDFYADVLYGIFRINDSFITHDAAHFSATTFYKELKKVETIISKFNEELYFQLWKYYFDLFANFLANNLPNTKVIINRAKFSSLYRDKKGNISQFSKNIDFDNYNRLWEKFDNYALSNYNFRAFEFDYEKHVADLNCPWGVNYVHYVKDFYVDCYNKLNEFVISDFLDK